MSGEPEHPNEYGAIRPSGGEKYHDRRTTYNRKTGSPNSGELSSVAPPIEWAVRVLSRWSRPNGCMAYDPATMAQSRFHATLRIVLRIAHDLLRLLSTAAR